MKISVKKTLFTVSQVFAIIVGVISLFGIITIPLSVFLFIASTKLSELNAMGDREFAQAMNDNKYLGWNIYVLIMTFPVGICALLPYVTDSIDIKDKDEVIIETVKKEPAEEKKPESEKKTETESTMDELDILFEKKEKGIITEEEYKTLKKNVLDKMKKD
jgi:hypothetical protein